MNIDSSFALKVNTSERKIESENQRTGNVEYSYPRTVTDERFHQSHALLTRNTVKNSALY